MTVSANLTPNQLARLWRVDPKKVLAWIKSGELAAMNFATKRSGSPRYRITHEAAAEFERRRSTVHAAKSDEPRHRCRIPKNILQLV